MATLPKKLKRDTIVEALFEVQFEHSDVAEVVIGRLAASSAWSGYQHQGLPVAQLPSMVRDGDPNLRYQPIIQLTSTARPGLIEAIKIGSRVLSVHSLAPYPGWASFGERVKAATKALFDAIPELDIRRLGLRYLNALTPEHGVNTLWDLSFELSVGGTRPADQVNATYSVQADDLTAARVTIASPSFVQGGLPDAAAVVDLDVSTIRPLGRSTPEFLFDWAERAHELEKRCYFSLWPEALLHSLTEE